MATLDAAQRQFVVKRIAQYCPHSLITSAFANRWKVILKAEIAELDPDFGALLGPEDDALFRQSRAEVDPRNEGVGSRTVQLIVLNWQFKDANSRGDHRTVAAIIERVNAMPPTPLDTTNVDRTPFIRRIIDPAEPVEPCQDLKS